MQRRPHGVAARVLVVFALAALSLLAACDRGVLAPPTLEPLLVHPDGRWFRDAKERVVLLRGVDYLALVGGRTRGPVPDTDEDDFRRLAELGFNLVRLPVPWRAVAPRPGDFDLEYLRQRVDPLLRFASNAGMPVVLAMHAGWSACVDGRPRRPWTCPDLPSEGDAGEGVPLGMRIARAQCAFFAGAEASDGRPLLEHYADAWRIVAAYYEQDKRIFAFDLLDEPTAAGCSSKAKFVVTALAPFYRTLQKSVRSTDAPHALAFQPAATPDEPLAAVGRGFGPGVVFAPHLFGQTFGPPADARGGERLAADYERARRLAQALGGPLLVGLVGSDGAPAGAYRPTTLPFVADSFAQLDRQLASGALWAVVPKEDPRAKLALDIHDGSVARVLARPYARRIAGLPIEMELDEESGVWRFAFRDDPKRRPPDPTEIFLPARLRYPDGFTVEVTPGDRWTFDERLQRLLVYRGPRRTVGEVHTVRVAPAAR
ncbi:MAG TPA: cellulase family glycosylhydrolase [Candidatus Binatia bacterium]